MGGVAGDRRDHRRAHPVGQPVQGLASGIPAGKQLEGRDDQDGE